MKIIVGIATIHGREQQLQNTFESLCPYVDEINIYHNGKEAIDYTDNAKFESLKKYKEPIYFFSCDDDIIYPPNYIEKTIKLIDRFNCIVTYHGRILRGKGIDYYKSHQSFSCKATNTQNRYIDVAGTGVTAFRTDYFNPREIYNSEYKRMSDLVFSLEVRKQGKKILLGEHQYKWIQVQNIPLQNTIYGMEFKNQSKQIQLADAIYITKIK